MARNRRLYLSIFGNCTRDLSKTDSLQAGRTFCEYDENQLAAISSGSVDSRLCALRFGRRMAAAYCPSQMVERRILGSYCCGPDRLGYLHFLALLTPPPLVRNRFLCHLPVTDAL